jgi:hypothetical protein
VDARNRRDQAHFHCLNCGFSANADYNAVLVLAKRFGDDELNRRLHRDVKAMLQARFDHSLLVVHSATTGRDTQGGTAQVPPSGQACCRPIFLKIQELFPFFQYTVLSLCYNSIVERTLKGDAFARRHYCAVYESLENAQHCHR